MHHFVAGAALAMLDLVLRGSGTTLPWGLLRDRLALDAAVTCLRLEGRNDYASDIRDAVCLARAGDAVGPAGEMFMAWRKLARIDLSVSSWRGQVMTLLPDQLSEDPPEFGTSDGSPVAQAARVFGGQPAEVSTP